MTDPEFSIYVTRIGYRGNPTPTLETLNDLVFRHVCTIPFENADVLLDRPIELDPQALFAKLVLRRRGGYCYEQNGLFADVLQTIGFDAKILSARPRVVFTRDQTPPLSHATIVVKLDGERWLIDTGIGGLSPSAPVRWVENVEQQTLHDTRRVVKDDERWFQQVLVAEGWKDVMEFTGQEMPLPDREIANFFTSRHPKSHFRRNAYAALALPNGGRHTLLGGRFTHRVHGEVVRTFMVEKTTDLKKILEEEFLIELPEGAILPEPILD